MKEVIIDKQALCHPAWSLDDYYWLSSD